MVCMEVYTKCAQIKYLSTICSKATFFITITNIISVIFPLIFAYNTKGFWLKRDSFFEQPNIKYKHEYIFYAEDEFSNSILCNNVLQLHKSDINTYKCSAIKVHEFDYNNDGKYDELYFSVSIDSIEALNIKFIVLILAFDYKIEDVCPLELRTESLIQYKSENSGIKFSFIGDIILSQQELLTCNHPFKNDEFNNSLIEPSNFDLWKFINNKFKRKISTKIENSYNWWVSGSSSSFNIEINLRYPYQLVYYKPNFWQVIKFAWIQYLSLYIAISWIINKIQNYVFTNKLVLYHVEYSDKKLK